MAPVLLVAVLVLVAGCAEEAQKVVEVRKLGEAMSQASSNLAIGTQVDPVDFRELKALMPESVAGLKRSAFEGSKTSVMGVGSSKATARYEDGKGARVEIEIIDVGTFSGVTALAFSWIHIEIDQESDDGYERTTTVGGRKAFERYSKRTRSGELDVIVAGRFVVAVRGSGIDVAAFRTIVDKLDLKKLESFKSRGVPAVDTTAKK